MTRDEVLEAIRVTAEANGGTPLGERRFTRETGIAKHHWQKYGTLGKLQEELGFSVNEMNKAKSEGDLVDQFISLCSRYQKFPTEQQLKQARQEDPSSFASHGTFDRLGKTKALKAATIVAALSEEQTLNPMQQAALDICLPIAEQGEVETTDPDAKLVGCGYVYLFRDGKAYKIGNSTDPDSRRAALQTGNPRRISLVHRIITDDPKGIEDYWHRRFSQYRIRITEGHEWFNLSRDDIAAFKARVRM